ncbi:hypothetical protein ACP8Y2_07385 [Herpetosiphon llansteffanensis]
MSELFEVSEVQNYGGFFGGDTVTLDVMAIADHNDWRPLVIDAKALQNIPERHNLLAGMVLTLEFSGERVDRAVLIAARDYDELRAALGVAQLPTTSDEPIKLSGCCSQCQRWLPAQHLHAQGCVVCTPA